MESRTVRLKLGLGSAGKLMTPEGFDGFTRFDGQYRDGPIRRVLIVSRLPSVAGSDPNQELGRLLRNDQADHPQGSAMDKTLAERYFAVADDWTGPRPPRTKKD